MDEIQPQTTLRDTLEANLTEAEAGTLPNLDEARDQRARDDAGRFAAKPKEETHDTPKPAPDAPAITAAAPQPQGLQRPTTWKKDYLPIWDKLAIGQALTPDEAKKLAEYSNQRENEYKTGVSTYKAEATAAKELQEAITPFLPELQSRGIQPSAWIKSLGTAHYTLAKGSPEMKLQVFRELAHQYGVPIGALLQNPQQVPPIVNDLMAQIQELKQQVTSVNGWRQQQESTSLSSEIAKFEDATKYPHFALVREQMAQLLELGLAPDLDTAYKKSVWLVDDAREAEQLRMTEQNHKPAVLAKARATAVSPKSATPSGQVVTSGAKDRRATLEESFDSLAGGRV